METGHKEPVTLDERNQEGKPLVLIVDDNPGHAKLFELLSERLHIAVQVVGNCGQALKALERNDVDLVVMDWLMPEVDGLICTARIRHLESQTGRHTPIIGVSGHHRASYERSIEAGMDDFLPLPFTLEQLHATLGRWLPGKKQ